MSFVPDDFSVPAGFVTAHLKIRKLCARDVYLDYLAVISSIDLIKRLRGGGDWPSQDLTIEDDLIDLAWHQREFERQSSFAYTVMNPDESECLGCLYIVPPHFRPNVPEGAEAVVSCWVTQKAYDAGLYAELYKAMKAWLEKEWPFNNLHWLNTEIPQD